MCIISHLHSHAFDSADRVSGGAKGERGDRVQARPLLRVISPAGNLGILVGDGQVARATNSFIFITRSVIFYTI